MRSYINYFSSFSLYMPFAMLVPIPFLKRSFTYVSRLWLVLDVARSFLLLRVLVKPRMTSRITKCTLREFRQVTRKVVRKRGAVKGNSLDRSSPLCTYMYVCILVVLQVSPFSVCALLCDYYFRFKDRALRRRRIGLRGPSGTSSMSGAVVRVYGGY